MSFQLSDIILLVFCITVMLSFIVHIIFEKYTTYSKKYKNLEIAEKVSKIASKNKIIVILGDEIHSYYCLALFEIFAFFVMGIFTPITELNKGMCELIVNINIVAIIITMISVLIRSIYYIILYKKEIKANKC